jgi:hypothetical protein
MRACVSGVLSRSLTWRKKLVVDFLNSIENVLLRSMATQLDARFVEAQILTGVLLVEKLPEIVSTDRIFE